MKFTQSQYSVPRKLGKFEASKAIVRESWAVLKQDREMLLFPVLSMILCFLITGLAFVVTYSLWTDVMLSPSDSETPIYVGYVAIFVAYIVMSFIGNFANAGVLIIAHGRFNGNDLTFKDGINGALGNIYKIFLWSLISATVKIILDYLAHKFKWIGKLVAKILGTAWDIMTYFSFPSIIIGQNSIRGSFRESASIIRKTWGETFIVTFGVALFFTVIVLVFMAIGFLLVYFIQTTFITVMVVSLCIVFILVISIISSTLSTIYKLALYEYARTGVLPQGFSGELKDEAFKK